MCNKTRTTSSRLLLIAAAWLAVVVSSTSSSASSIARRQLRTDLSQQQQQNQQQHQYASFESIVSSLSSSSAFQVVVASLEEREEQTRQLSSKSLILQRQPQQHHHHQNQLSSPQQQQKQLHSQSGRRGHRSLLTSSSDYSDILRDVKDRSLYSGQVCRMSTDAETSGTYQRLCDNISLIFTLQSGDATGDTAVSTTNSSSATTESRIVTHLQACKSRTTTAQDGSGLNITTNVCLDLGYQSGQTAYCNAHYWNGQATNAYSKNPCNACVICPDSTILVSVDCGTDPTDAFLSSLGDEGPYCMDLGQYLYQTKPIPRPQPTSAPSITPITTTDTSTTEEEESTSAPSFTPITTTDTSTTEEEEDGVVVQQSFPTGPLLKTSSFDRMAEQLSLLYSSNNSTADTSCSFQSEESAGAFLVERIWVCTSNTEGEEDLTIKLVGFKQSTNGSATTGGADDDFILLKSFSACRTSATSSEACVTIEYNETNQPFDDGSISFNSSIYNNGGGDGDGMDSISLTSSTATTCVGNASSSTCNRCIICTLENGEFGLQMNCDNVDTKISTADSGNECKGPLEWLEQTAVAAQVEDVTPTTAAPIMPTTAAPIMPSTPPPTMAPFTPSPTITKAPFATSTSSTTSDDPPTTTTTTTGGSSTTVGGSGGGSSGKVLTLPPLTSTSAADDDDIEVETDDNSVPTTSPLTSAPAAAASTTTTATDSDERSSTAVQPSSSSAAAVATTFQGVFFFSVVGVLTGTALLL